MRFSALTAHFVRYLAQAELTAYGLLSLLAILLTKAG
jgi:hypothetical protein